MRYQKRSKLPRGLRWDPRSPYICFSWRDGRKRLHQQSTGTADPAEAMAFKLRVTTMETSAAHNIVDAMQRNGVRRLLKISVVGAGESVKNAGFFNEQLLMRTFLRGLLVDKAGMEAEIEGSHLDWTLVRPPMFQRREDRRCQGAVHGGGEKAHKIGRADPGSLHGAATGKQPVCASGRDSDDHIARPPRGNASNESCDR